MTRSPLHALRRWWRRLRQPGTPLVRSFRCLESVAPVGGTFTLVWDVAGAGVVRLEPGYGEVPARGMVQVPADPAIASWVLVAAARSGTVQQVLARPPLVQPAARLGSHADLPRLARRPRPAAQPVPVTTVPIRTTTAPAVDTVVPRPLPQPFAWRRRPAPRLRVEPVPVALPAELLLPAWSRATAAE